MVVTLNKDAFKLYLKEAETLYLSNITFLEW